MRQALCTIRVAGAWNYRVVLTDEIDDLGFFDSRVSELLLSTHQSAATAAGTLCHEFVEAWEYHIEHDRKRMEAAVKALAATMPELAGMLREGAIESKSTMIGCYMAECKRLNVDAMLAKHFEPQPIADATALTVAQPATTDAPGELSYEKPFVSRVRTARRCECPRCHRTINANLMVVAPKPRYHDKAGAWFRDHAFPCEDCAITVCFKVPVDADPEEPFDAAFDRVQIVEGAARKAVLEFVGEIGMC